PTSVNLVASTLTNGALTSRARRRAISVLPTPVGPIIKMFFGLISSRRPSGSFWRRQRLRKATATARLAAFWPTMYLSSSATISRGVSSMSHFLHDDAVVGVHAHRRGDTQRLLGDLPRGKRRMGRQRLGRRQGEGAARADGGHVV